MSTSAETHATAIVERFTLRAFVESCLVLEEGVATARDIDLGMMAGAGITPPPLAKADVMGLDDLLVRLERAEQEWGEDFTPPMILRRLVNQGRLGVKTGQGFFPYPQPDAGWEERPVKLETRGEVAIAWLDRPPANSLSPEVIETITELWEAVQAAGSVRVLIFASANPMLFCAGADIKAFQKMDAAAGRRLLDGAHGLFRSFETSGIVTIAAVNAAALGGGCELAMACDFRLAADSANFGQPEINLGIIPGFGGTQRLPRLIGEARARELNLIGDAIGAAEALEYGLANRVVADHDLLDTALAWARKLAGQAPLSVAEIKRVSAVADLDAGIEAEKSAFQRVFGSADANEGISAFLPEALGAVERRVSPAAARVAQLIREADSVVALTGAGISVPSGIPDFRSPGTGLWTNVDPMEVAHIDVFRRDPQRFWHFYGDRFQTLEHKQPNRAHIALATLERAGLLDAVITQNIDRLHTRAGTRELVEVHGTIDHSSCLACGARYPLADVHVRQLADEDGIPRCDCSRPLKPGVVLFGEYLPVDALVRAEQLAAGADLMLCVGSSLEVHPVAALPELTLSAGGRVAIVTQGRTPYDGRAEVKLDGDVEAEVEAVLAYLSL